MCNLVIVNPDVKMRSQLAVHPTRKYNPPPPGKAGSVQRPMDTLPHLCQGNRLVDAHRMMMLINLFCLLQKEL